MADPTVDLWAGDEVHFQQHGALPDVGPAGNQGPGLAARSDAAQRGILWGGAAAGREVLLLPRGGGLSFFAFLKGLRRTSIRSGRRVVLITDNAKYHHALLHKPWREEHVTALRWTICRPTVPS